MTVLCLTIQCLALAVMMQQLARRERRGKIVSNLWGAIQVLTLVTLIIFVGNLLQIGLWAMLFVFIGEFTELTTAFYHSLVNFTTLGYGDIVMSKERRMLGALEALNGVLMIGLSTATLFAVLSQILEQAWASEDRSLRKGS